MVATLRQAFAGFRLLLVLTVALGLVYPLVVYGVGRLGSGRADGSLVEVDGVIVGSALVGQDFEGDQWFHSRPSAAGDGYDPLASGASNLGPENPDLLAQVEERRAEVATRESVDPADVPADALTASGSGLDPHVSPEYARLQVERVARVRDLPEGEVAALVEEAVRGRDLGILGQPRVNVLELNVALQELDGRQG
jgi:K+-transporting ATPase ATPase C chain